MGVDIRTVLFVVVQILFLYAYLAYYGAIRQWVPLAQSVLSGILAGVLLLLLAPVIHFFFPYSDAVRSAVLKAALIEKGISFVFILILIRLALPSAGIGQSVSTGIHYGAGFAFLENLIYALSYQVDSVYIRFISSVPMHLATCGLQAYFLGMARSYNFPGNRWRSYALAIVLPVLLHSFYDLSCLPGQRMEVLTGPVIVLSVFLFEILYSRMRTFPDMSYLSGRMLRLEDWFALQKQVGFAKWILYSSGTKNLPRIPFLHFRANYLRVSVAIVMLVLTILYWIDPAWYRGILRVDLNDEYRMALFAVMPASFSVVFFAIGSVNSEYFRNKRVRIPVVVDVSAQSDQGRVSGIAYEISSSAMFVHSEEFFEEGQSITLDMSYLNRSSPHVAATVRTVVRGGDEDFPSGMIVDLESNTGDFRSFYRRYRFFRLRKGLSFFLQLSGSHAIRALFVRPLTVMQSERGYRAGDVIFRQGDPGRRFYLIKKGQVTIFKELENGNQLKLSELGVGSIFGEMAIMSDNVRSATAKCTADCVLAIAHRDHLDALMRANPDFVAGLIRNLIQIIDKNEQEISRLRQKE